MPRAPRRPNPAGRPAAAVAAAPYVCRRGRTLADAFDHLSSLLPCYPPNKKMTKIDTLRLAMMYIKDLRVVVQGFQDESEPETESEGLSSPSADVSLQRNAANRGAERALSDGASDRSKPASPSLDSSRSSLGDVQRPRSVASPSGSEISNKTFSNVSAHSRSIKAQSPALSRGNLHNSTSVPSSLAATPLFSTSSSAVTPSYLQTQQARHMSLAAECPAPDMNTSPEMLNWPAASASLGITNPCLAQTTLPPSMQQQQPQPRQSLQPVELPPYVPSPSSMSSMSSDSALSFNTFDQAPWFSFQQQCDSSHTQSQRVRSAAARNPSDMIAQLPSQTQDTLFQRDVMHCKQENAAALGFGMSQAWMSPNNFFSPPRQLGMVGGMRSLYHN